jgi:hypothetical protein
MKIENIDNTLEEIQEVGDQMRAINEAVAQVGRGDGCLSSKGRTGRPAGRLRPGRCGGRAFAVLASACFGAADAVAGFS